MRVATHSGTFHADEVFALAALGLVEQIEVIRTRDRATMDECDLRVDVGRRYDPASGDFDHHQPGGAGVRPNGIGFASFGLVWERWGVDVCGGSARVAADVDERLVQPIDAIDVGQTLLEPRFDGVVPYSVGYAIGSFNPVWDEGASHGVVRDRFHKALAFATGVIRREVAGVSARERAGSVISEAIAEARDPRLIELSVGCPWRESVIRSAPEALYVIYPKDDGSWALQCVPAAVGSFDNRRSLPASWAGLADEELVTATGVPGARFCHSGCFLAVAESREGILALAERALAD